MKIVLNLCWYLIWYDSSFFYICLGITYSLSLYICLHLFLHFFLSPTCCNLNHTHSSMSHLPLSLPPLPLIAVHIHKGRQTQNRDAKLFKPLCTGGSFSVSIFLLLSLSICCYHSSDASLVRVLHSEWWTVDQTESFMICDWVV